MDTLEHKKKEFYTPWMAGSVVALLGPFRIPPTTIRNWTARGYLDDILNIKPGQKYSPILYSLSSACQLQGMYDHYCRFKDINQAIRAGKAFRQFASDIFLNPDKFSHADHVCIFWKKNRDDEEIQFLYIPTYDMMDQVAKSGWPTPVGNRFNGSHRCVTLWDIQGFIRVILEDYYSVGQDFNQKALEGRLKPFPKMLPTKEEAASMEKIEQELKELRQMHEDLNNKTITISEVNAKIKNYEKSFKETIKAFKKEMEEDQNGNV